MVRLSHIVSIATLVVHLVVGCCAHIARACEGRDAVWAGHYRTLFAGHCPNCSCDPWRRGSEERQDRKYFLAPPRRPMGGFVDSPFQPPCVVCSGTDVSRAGVSLHREFRTTGRLSPIRLHLVKRVLLI